MLYMEKAKENGVPLLQYLYVDLWLMVIFLQIKSAIMTTAVIISE